MGSGRTTVALIVVALSGCRQQTVEPVGARIGAAPVPATGTVHTGACDLDLSGEKAVTVFRTLGMLSEYLGRDIVEGSDIVEGFGADERPVAEAFGRVGQRLATEQHLEEPSLDESDGALTFHSRPMTERLNSCYSYDLSSGWRQQGPHGTMVRGTGGALPTESFRRGGTVTLDPAGGESNDTLYRQRALAYVSGAWLRSHRGADFVFANNEKKSARIAGLLHGLGASRVTIESTVGLIPQTNMVHFTPTPLITEWLNQRW